MTNESHHENVLRSQQKNAEEKHETENTPEEAEKIAIEKEGDLKRIAEEKEGYIHAETEEVKSMGAKNLQHLKESLRIEPQELQEAEQELKKLEEKMNNLEKNSVEQIHAQSEEKNQSALEEENQKNLAIINTFTQKYLSGENQHKRLEETDAPEEKKEEFANVINHLQEIIIKNPEQGEKIIEKIDHKEIKNLLREYAGEFDVETKISALEKQVDDESRDNIAEIISLYEKNLRGKVTENHPLEKKIRDRIEKKLNDLLEKNFDEAVIFYNALPDNFPGREKMQKTIYTHAVQESENREKPTEKKEFLREKFGKANASDMLAQEALLEDRSKLWDKEDQKNFYEKLSPEQKNTLFDQLLQQNPEELFYKISFFETNPEQRTQLLEKMTHGPVALDILTGKYNQQLHIEQPDLVNIFIQERPEIILNFPQEVALTPEQIEVLINEAMVKCPENLLQATLQKTELADKRAGIFKRILFETDDISVKKVAMILEHDDDIKNEVLKKIDTLHPERLSKIATALSDRFLYSFENDPEGAAQKSIANREVALRIFERLPDEKKQEVLPHLLEHALDQDFGDRKIAEKIFSSIKDTARKEEVEKILTEDFTNKEERIKKFHEKLSKISSENAEKFRSELNQKHGKETVAAVVEKTEKTKFLTINIKFEHMEKILQAGRMKSNWETKVRGDKKSHYTEQYLNDKERLFGIRSKGTEQDPHPIYGALAIAGQEKTGGIPEEDMAKKYGDCYVKLREESIKERTGFCYGDSMEYLFNPQELNENRFTWENVAVARAKLELDTEKHHDRYIEAQILGGVTLEDIELFHIPKKYEREAETLKMNYPNAQFIIE